MSLKIGDVARGAGVSVDAVRFYERRGLVSPQGRTASGYRFYGEDAIERIGGLKLLQSLGLSLDEIGGVLDDAGGAGVQCHHLDGALEQVAARLDAKIAELTRLRASVGTQLDRCRVGACGTADDVC